MFVPCTVKILWNVLESGMMFIALPGINKSVRIAIAKAPPIMNAVSDRYT